MSEERVATGWSECVGTLAARPPHDLPEAPESCPFKADIKPVLTPVEIGGSALKGTV